LISLSASVACLLSIIMPALDIILRSMESRAEGSPSPREVILRVHGAIPNYDVGVTTTERE
jgi:hypothetical protein